MHLIVALYIYFFFNLPTSKTTSENFLLCRLSYLSKTEIKCSPVECPPGTELMPCTSENPGNGCVSCPDGFFAKNTSKRIKLSNGFCQSFTCTKK